MTAVRWGEQAQHALRAAAGVAPAGPDEGVLVLGLDGTVQGADSTALCVLHQTWEALDGAAATDPRVHAYGSDGRELPVEQLPAVVCLRTGAPVRRFVMGIDSGQDDDPGSFLWLQVDVDPLRDDGGAMVGAIARIRDVSGVDVGQRATQRLIRSFRQLARDATEEHERFRAMVESSGDVVLAADADGCVVWCSSSVRRVLGHQRGDVVGLRVLDLVHEDDGARAAARMRDVEAGDDVVRDELRVRRADGGWIWMSGAWRAMTGPAGEAFGVLVSLRDVHDDVERREALLHRVHHDSLTGLLNRDSAFAWMRDELEVAAVAGRKLGVMYLDIDFFKEVNDIHGHGVGDQVLASVAEKLRSAVRGDDMVARAGGDEFVVGLRVVPDVEAVERRAASVLEAVRSLVLESAGDVTVSIGLAVDAGSGDVQTVLERADAALYRAKRDGRNRFSW